MKAINKL